MTDLSWQQARAVAAELGWQVAPRATELVSLVDCVGRTSAVDVVARIDLPAFDTVAMDGWAVRGAAPWRVVGTLAAGDLPDPVWEGDAVQVATGAVLPEGSSGIVRREEGHVADGQLTGPSRADVRRRGEQCRAGDVLLSPGETVTPAGAGLLAAAGLDDVAVLASPDVTAFVLGAELITSGVPTMGEVRDAIGPLLDGFVTPYGGHLLDVTHIDDDLDATIAALDTDVDVIVVSGGTSAGPTDHLRAALHQVGAALVVDGVDVRPGHPMLLAQLPRGRCLVGLPGNPLAAVAGIVTLLWPLLDGMHRRVLRPLPCFPLEVHGGDLPRMTTLHPALLTAGGLQLLPHAGPAMLRGLARADVLAVLSAGDSVPGAPVPCLPLPPGRR